MGCVLLSVCLAWAACRVLGGPGLEGQAALTGPVGECRHATVVLVAGPVEDDAVDPGRLGPLGDQLTDALGLLGLVAGHTPEVGLHGGGRRQGAADGVVDDLRG